MAESIRDNSLYNKEIYIGDFYPVTKAYYYREWNGFSMPFHAHNAIEIMYVIHGQCLIEIEDKAVVMKKGEFILLDANVSHRLQVENDTPCRMLNIEFGFTKKSSQAPSFRATIESSGTLSKFLKTKLSYIVLKDSEEIYITMKSLIMELDQNKNSESFLALILYAQLFIRLSRLYCESLDKNPNRGAVHVKKAIMFMHQNYDKDIRTKDIAAAANVHAGYLHRIFKSNKGLTINQYLMDLRMEKAKSLLTNTDISIIDISCYVGFNSSQYFHYVFKKKTGFSPSDFRKSVIKSVNKY